VLLLPAGAAAFFSEEMVGFAEALADLRVCFCPALRFPAEAEAGGAVVAPLDDCPPSGSTIISKESRTARLRNDSRATEVGEEATLISLL
jgi:hypothetical protein